MKNNQKGLTLIEVIISIALLGLVSIVFITLFSTGFMGIVRAGDKSVATYESQMDNTNKLTSKDLDADDYIEDEITINFGSELSIDLDIRIIETTTDINGIKSNMTSFILKP